MRGRRMYRAKALGLGACVMVLMMLMGELALLPGRGKLNAQRSAKSPSGEFMAFALPFDGPGPQSIQGGLVIYLSANSSVIDRRQTSLQGTRETRLEWIAGASPESFRVFDEQGTRMVWRVEGRRAVCVEGTELLLPVAKEEKE